MKRILALVLPIIVILALCVTSCGPLFQYLVTDSNQRVGSVQVWNDQDYLHVKYVANGDWSLAETHLFVATTIDAIPQDHGNPLPQDFQPYSTNHDPYVSEYEYLIPCTWLSGTQLYIAANALMAKICGSEAMSLEDFCGTLPDTVVMNYVYNSNTTYFNTTISGGSSLDGMYDGWCIDLDRSSLKAQDLNAKVLCSYDPLAANYVKIPGNLDLVNWIFNQNFIGKAAPDDLGIYSWQDIQMAVWRLLVDPNHVNTAMSKYTDAKVNSIIESAQANGEGFVPGCDDVIVIILVPVNQAGQVISQINIITIDYPCEIPTYCFENAWCHDGCGCTGSGVSWAVHYFVQ